MKSSLPIWNYITWFCSDILSCGIPWNLSDITGRTVLLTFSRSTWNIGLFEIDYFTSFLEGGVFLKRRKMPKYLMLK